MGQFVPLRLAFVPFETRYPPEWVQFPDAAEESDRVMVYDPVPIAETWAAMEALVEAYHRQLTLRVLTELVFCLLPLKEPPVYLSFASYKTSDEVNECKPPGRWWTRAW